MAQGNNDPTRAPGMINADDSPLTLAVMSRLHRALEAVKTDPNADIAERRAVREAVIGLIGVVAEIERRTRVRD